MRFKVRTVNKKNCVRQCVQRTCSEFPGNTAIGSEVIIALSFVSETIDAFALFSIFVSLWLDGNPL